MWSTVNCGAGRCLLRRFGRRSTEGPLKPMEGHQGHQGRSMSTQGSLSLEGGPSRPTGGPLKPMQGHVRPKRTLSGQYMTHQHGPIPTQDSLRSVQSHISPTEGPISPKRGPLSPTQGPLRPTQDFLKASKALSGQPGHLCQHGSLSPAKDALRIAQGPLRPTNRPLWVTDGPFEQNMAS